MLLGCIADDFTGATDLANMLVRGGMRTIQTIGLPTSRPENVDAVVVALKTRTIRPEDAVAQSLDALAWLKANGAQQIYFKYCSTFDSTAKGNIGPVMDALMRELKTDFTIACPAFPENGRTIFRGYLYVGDVLLSESGMKDHPLTPMIDANLVRVLKPQTAHKVGLIRYDTVAQGPEAVRERIAALRQEGVCAAVVDAVSDADLATIGAACAEMPLVTAGSGVGLGIALNHRAAGNLKHASEAAQLPRLAGRSAVVSGSCSLATNGQVKHWVDAGRAAIRIDALELASDAGLIARIVEQALEQVAKAPVLVYATAPPEEVKRVQAALGVERAGQITEAALAEVARALVERGGVSKLVAAGGESSGAVVQALGVESLRIGPQIDPGVPWTMTGGPKPIALALKSGNFGTPDFFSKALRQIEA